jgi:hypothetical protein
VSDYAARLALMKRHVERLNDETSERSSTAGGASNFALIFEAQFPIFRALLTALPGILLDEQERDSSWRMPFPPAPAWS